MIKNRRLRLLAQIRGARYSVETPFHKRKMFSELIEIDNRGERLTGCLTCNLWSATDSKRWTRLSVEDLHALHHLRHGGRSRKRAPD
jgi:hypothetical protein